MSNWSYGQNLLAQVRNMFFNLLDSLTSVLKYLHQSLAASYQHRPASRNCFLQNGNKAAFAATVSITLKDDPCPRQFITVICSKTYFRDQEIKRRQFQRSTLKTSNPTAREIHSGALHLSTTLRGSENTPGALCCIHLLSLICSKRF